MKELSPLKVFASYYVDLQENMSGNEKGQIRTFIQSASLHQVIALLTEGKMRTIKPIEESLLESSFANSGMGFLMDLEGSDIKRLSEMKNPVITKKLSASASAALILTKGYSVFVESSKKTSKLNSLKKQLTTIKESVKFCNESKNPKKCVEEINKKIKTLHSKLV